MQYVKFGWVINPKVGAVRAWGLGIAHWVLTVRFGRKTGIVDTVFVYFKRVYTFNHRL